MTKVYDGGRAFPHNFPPEHPFGDAGMSLRDWFAGQNMAALISGNAAKGAIFPSADEIAAAAYRMADAMIAARGAK